MGVGGLETFVGKKHRLECVELLKCRVVIDGCGLYYFIHDHNNIQGLYAGDYPQFEKSTRRFFQILKDCDIEPYVVFDGAMDKEGRKWSTVKTKAKEKLKNAQSVSSGKHRTSTRVFPLLTSETFRQVLDELRIPHVQCDFEGDAGIAALANHFECPVMARDSDFFVFDLKAGYVPFYTLTLPTNDTEVRKTLQAKQYHQHSFLSQFGLKDKKMMPLFATLVGNDFVKSESFRRFFSKENFPKEKPAKMEELLNWLKDRDTYEEALDGILETWQQIEADKTGKRTLIEKSVELYTNLPQNLVDYVTRTGPEKESSELKFSEGESFPDQFNRLIRQGQVSSILMDVIVHGRFVLSTQVEQMTKKSVFQCSRPIRAATYAILLGLDTSWKIREVDRVKEKLEELEISIKHVKKFARASLQDIFDIQRLSPDERRSFLLGILGLNKDFIESIQEDDNFKLVLITLMYWGRNSELELNECHLMAVLISLLEYKTPLASSTEAARAESGHFRRRNLVHAFAQFQACFYDILHLNQLLESPYQSPSPARFYDGKLLHDLTRKLKKRDNRASREQFVANGFNANPTAFKTFQNLYGKLRAALPPEVFPSGFKLAPVAPKVPPSNRFELLELSD